MVLQMLMVAAGGDDEDDDQYDDETESHGNDAAMPAIMTLSW